MSFNTAVFKSNCNYQLEADEVLEDEAISIKPSTRVDKQLLVGLSHFQKILLTTNGSVTDLLEHYLDEVILVKKLYEEFEKNIDQLPDKHKLHIPSNDMFILKRKVLLQGQATLNSWVYAESTILVNHLMPNFRTDLLVSLEPIGKLWSKYQLETYKNLLTIGREKAGSMLADHFHMPVDGEVMSRIYSVYSHGKIIMIITEKFPIHFFCDKPC